MGFAEVAGRIAAKKNISKKRASAILAGGTRRNMRKRGMKTSGRIPKDVWDKDKE